MQQIPSNGDGQREFSVQSSLNGSIVQQYRVLSHGQRTFVKGVSVAQQSIVESQLQSGLLFQVSPFISQHAKVESQTQTVLVK